MCKSNIKDWIIHWKYIYKAIKNDQKDSVVNI